MCTHFGATETNIERYRRIFEAALEGVSATMFHDSRKAYAPCLKPFRCAFLRVLQSYAHLLCVV